jgi:S-(hydroxymethyl)glutathione dehydrogenase / alcohol dehydrogenase
MKTKAAVLHEVGQPLEIEELDLEGPKEGEVLVKFTASGVCHSDYSVRYGVLHGVFPMVLGHEGAGIVEDVGPGVDHLSPGDHIVAALTPSCGQCGMCREGKPYICTQMGRIMGSGAMIDGTTRFKLGDMNIHQLCAVGSFAERAVMPAGAAIKVDDAAPLDTVCLVGCGVTTGVGAAINTAQVTEGSSVAVIGCGGVGLSIIQGARVAGAAIIIAVDPVEEKRALAQQLGATHGVDPSAEDPVKAVRRLTGMGVHNAFEALGRTETIEQAWSMLRPAGKAIVVGLPSLKESVKLGAAGLFAEKRITGSSYGSAVPARDIPKYVEWVQDGKLDLDSMITKRIRLEDVNAAFDEMGRGEGARSVIMYD